jgi:hypothetical protein
VVPPALQVTAMNIMNATEIRVAAGSGSATTDQAVAKNWVGNQVAEVVVNPWLPIVDSSANKNTTWYLFADPGAGRPAMEVGFLRGHESPELFLKSPNASVSAAGWWVPRRGRSRPTASTTRSGTSSAGRSWSRRRPSRTSGPEMARVYLPESSKPKRTRTPEEVAPVTGRVYLPSVGVAEAGGEAGCKAAKAEAKAPGRGGGRGRGGQGEGCRGGARATPTPTPSTLSDESGAARRPSRRTSRPANATTEAWAEYARTKKGASPDDLLDGDGQPLGRNALREKYGTPSQ